MPVKEIVTDLSTECLEVCLAALLWNGGWHDEELGVDQVEIPLTEPIYFANPISLRLLDVMEGFQKVFDGADL